MLQQHRATWVVQQQIEAFRQKQQAAKLPVKKPDAPHWEKISWSPELIQSIYRDWGLFCTYNDELDHAEYYYNKALEMKKDDHKTLFLRSICHRLIGNAEQARKDCEAAMKYIHMRTVVDVEHCDTVYECNEFEQCLTAVYENIRRYGAKRIAPFRNRLQILRQNFHYSLGPNAGPFIIKHGEMFQEVLNDHKRRMQFDDRPQWKKLRDMEKCDVMSTIEQDEVELSPLEIARRKRGFKVFNNIYFNRTGADITFMKELLDNRDLLMPVALYSTPYLRTLLSNKYKIVRKYMKMLQSRSPLYNKKARLFPSKKMQEKYHEEYMNRVQYQTRRNMFKILRTIHMLRALGKVQSLSKFIEEIMGSYTVLKTSRVMPWKIEFINEVYNTLGLAHTDRLVIPKAVQSPQMKNRISVLLHLPPDRHRELSQFVFGDRSTYHEPDYVDFKYMAYRKYIGRLEKRMRFAEYNIEISYLLHEAARKHLVFGHYDECVATARKGCLQAKLCKSNLWYFLNALMIVRANASLHKIEGVRNTLHKLEVVAQRLKSKPLADYIEMCLHVNREQIQLKHITMSTDSIKPIKSKFSASSRNSVFSQTSGGSGSNPSTTRDGKPSYTNSPH